ncbi:MAG: aminotransferase class I/II-fold pyridoxal phosphate-dependent enzyme [Anaerolineae bacterium]|nr:aminotransferase class I/II-fold pyridoxal phosphate-dependent enzyme [Anaerolineae bacterium]
MNTRSLVSQRAQRIPASGIRRFFDIAATMEDVISLGIGEPDFDTPAPIVQAGIESLQHGATHYTSNSGLMELRRAIADHMDALYAQTYNPASEIVVTVGVSEALYLAMAALLDPGDEIIFPEPCFVSYEPITLMVDAVPVTVPTYAEDGFEVTAEAIEAVVTERTKAIFIASPNNPTGTVMSREHLNEIAAVAKKHNLAVISDEIYDRLAYGVKHTCFASLPGMYQRTVVLQGFSKAYAMTGWRIGYLLGPAELVEEMRKIHQSLIMCAPSASQWAAIEALKNGEPFVQEMRAEYDRRRKLIVPGLNDLGLPCTEPKGAFYAFPCIQGTGMDDNEFAELLLQEERVAAIPGRAFGKSGKGYVRMSYATAYEKIEIALERIARFVQRHR